MAVDGWCYNYKDASWEKDTGPSPTDRAKAGTKRSIVVLDGTGAPSGVTVDVANRHDDMRMTKATLQSIVVHRPEPKVT